MSVKTLTLTPGIKHAGQSMILEMIVRQLENGPNVPVQIDLVSLAQSLSNLDERKSKSVMEIIMHFDYSNPQPFKVMSKAIGAPYGGSYNKVSNETSMDLANFPANLVIILDKFIQLNNSFKGKK